MKTLFRMILIVPRSVEFRRGVVALPTIIVISLIVLAGGIGIAGSGFVETLISFGDYESGQAFYAAESGVHDAIKRLLRDGNCACIYDLLINAARVSVRVEGENPKIITSTGRVGRKQRTLQVTATRDSNQKLTYSFWKEIGE